MLGYILELSKYRVPTPYQLSYFLLIFCNVIPQEAKRFMLGLKLDIENIHVVQPQFSFFLVAFGKLFYMDDSAAIDYLEQISSKSYFRMRDLYSLVVKFKTLSLHHWRIHKNLYHEIIRQYLTLSECKTRNEMVLEKLLKKKKKLKKEEQLGLIKEAIAYVVRRK